MVPIPTRVWPTPCAELSSWLALLGAARDHVWTLNAIGYGPPAPAGDIDHELALGAVQAARIASQPGAPMHAAHAPEMLLSLRREAAASDAASLAADTHDARLANIDAWNAYRGMLRTLEPVQAHIHARLSDADLGAWERGAS